MTRVLTETQPIRLKGRSFLALVLTPEQPFDAWLARLDNLAAGSAGFFLGRPIVLDLAGLDLERQQLRDLLDKLGGRDIRIMGIEGADPALLGNDMPPALSGGLPTSDPDAPGSNTADASTDSQAADGSGTKTPSIMVTQPVRSGQLILSEGDVTIVGSVASGAEVIAGGSVHVYGTVRGRIAAGTTGNRSARIFCRRLEAELIAIAGFYQTSDDFEPEMRGRAVQLWLDNDSILAQTLG